MGSQTFVGDDIPQQAAASFVDLVYDTATTPISVAVQSDREWAALTRALDRAAWREDARFRTVELRQLNIDARLELTQEALRERPAAEWLQRLDEAGVPCAPVLTRTATLADPQVKANGIVVEAEHPAAGRVRDARPAARFSATPWTAGQPAPGHGEHTATVLREAGLDEAAVDALRRQGAFGPVAEAAE